MLSRVPQEALCVNEPMLKAGGTASQAKRLAVAIQCYIALKQEDNRCGVVETILDDQNDGPLNDGFIF